MNLSIHNPHVLIEEVDRLGYMTEFRSASIVRVFVDSVRAEEAIRIAKRFTSWKEIKEDVSRLSPDYYPDEILWKRIELRS